VPLESVDPVYFESTYYLGPDTGGEKPYRLLSDALEAKKRVAVAQLVSRGKEKLVLIRAYQKGLVMHTAYYANEVRDFGQIPKGESVELDKQELQLALALIERLSSDRFRPDKYKDEYRLRLVAFLRAKAEGGEIQIAPEPPRRQARGRVIDIMDALKTSLKQAPARGAPAAAPKKQRKRA
jgi:DNA end-binding protein Ku